MSFLRLVYSTQGSHFVKKLPRCIFPALNGPQTICNEKINRIEFTQRRCFKNFGHKKDKEPPLKVAWLSFIVFSMIGLLIDWKA